MLDELLQNFHKNFYEPSQIHYFKTDTVALGQIVNNNFKMFVTLIIEKTKQKLTLQYIIYLELLSFQLK